MKLWPRGTRIYRTGDLARYLESGDIEFAGRADNQVKIRGFRVEPGEIEAALQQHGEVAEAVVVLRENRTGTKQLIAYAVSQQKPEILREFLKELLPAYMVPAAVETLEAFPMTSSGKIDRPALAARSPEQAKTAANFAPPHTESEKTLAAIWSQTLGLPQVGIHDNFFEIGGDSILSIQVIARARKAGLDLAPRLLFENQTIALLASRADELSLRPEAEQFHVSGACPLAPYQENYFLDIPAKPNYRTVMLKPVEPLDPTHLKQAAALLADHHDALRLRFSQEGEAWQQYHTDTPKDPFFKVHKLKQKNVASVVAAIASLHAKLDLEKGPLLALVLLQNTPEGELLVLSMHPLVVDQFSTCLLVADLQLILRQLSTGQKPHLPPKTVSFKAWVDSFLNRKPLPGQDEPWPVVARLPRKPKPEGSVAPVRATVTVALDGARTAALAQWGHEAYRTRNEDLLLVALARVVTQPGLPLPVAFKANGRVVDNLDLSRTVGALASLRTALVTLPEVGEDGAVIKAIKEQLRNESGAFIGDLPERPNPDHQPEILLICESGLKLPLEAPFTQVAEEIRTAVDLQKPLSYTLELEADMSAGLFHFHFDKAVLDLAGVEDLSGDFLAGVKKLIDHCLLDEHRGYTPSDFPLAHIGGPELDRLAAAHLDLEDLYRLSPMQEGMLFHTIMDERALAYTRQTHFRIEGPFHPEVFQKAIDRILEPPSRPAFLFSLARLPQPLQMVHAASTLPWHREDWSHLPRQR